MRKEILLCIAIISLGFSSLAFTGAQYFSETYMALLLLLPMFSIAIIIFVSTDYFVSGKRRNIIAAALAAASVLLMCLNAAFDVPPPGAFGTALSFLWLLALGTAICIAGICISGKVMRSLGKRRKPLACAVVAILLVLTAGAAYVSHYGFGNYSWGGVDELAVNYYSSYLFLHGINPYTQSMIPGMTSRGMSGPFTLNGTYDSTYHYPALSFLPYVPMVAAGFTSLMSFLFLLMLFAVISAFEVYYKSGFKKIVLLPISAWLGSSFFLSYNTNAYLAISVLLLFAYIHREKIPLSGILIGLAASAQQLSWFALPFFFLLTARERGSKKMATQMAFAFAAFIVVNGYFLVASPGPTLNSIFGVLLSNKMRFDGINIVGLLMAFYPVPYGYSALVCVAFMVAAMFLFYFYGTSVRTLLAVAPIFIFFLSWRNFADYGLSYIPLLLAVLYVGDSKGKKEADKLKGRKPMAIALCLVALIAVSSAVYLHGTYVNENLIRINGLTPIYSSQNGHYSLAGVVANLTNNGKADETVSFLIVTRNPDSEAAIAGSDMPLLMPGTTPNYQIGYSLPVIGSGTRLFLFVMSAYYVASGEVNITATQPSLIS